MIRVTRIVNLVSCIKKMPNFIRLHNKSYRWLINEAHQKFVQTHFVGKEDVLSTESGKSPLKDNNARTLFTMCINGQTELFIKRYKIDSIPRILRHFVASKAINELKVSNYLVTKGWQTVYPLAVVQKTRWGLPLDAFLIMRKLEDMPTLGGYLSSPRSREEIDEVINLSGELVKDIHNVNLFHRDLHTGNILIKPDAEPKELYIIDLHRAAILPGVSRAQRVFNLGQFAYSIMGHLPFTDIVRLIKAYRPLDQRQPRFKALVRDVYEMLLTIRHRHWQARNKRCFRTSSRHLVIKDGQKIFYINRSYSGMAEKLVSTLAGAELTGEVLKETPRHRLVRTQINVGQGESAFYYIKEYRSPSFLSRVKSLFGYHPARQNWLASNGLVLRGIPTARPVGLMLQKEPFYDWITSARIVTEEVKATPSNQYVMDTFASPHQSASQPVGRSASGPEDQFFKRKKLFIKEFALAIRRLHQKGVFHRDLKANNVLVKSASLPVSQSASQPADRWTFYFIDLDRVKFRRVLPWRERIKNMAQLNAAMPAVMTRADRLRFFRYYAYGEIPVKSGKERHILAEIMRITIARHHIWPR